MRMSTHELSNPNIPVPVFGFKTLYFLLQSKIITGALSNPGKWQGSIATVSNIDVSCLYTCPLAHEHIASFFSCSPVQPPIYRTLRFDAQIYFERSAKLDLVSDLPADRL